MEGLSKNSINRPVKDIERSLNANDFIVSKTDTKGRITYFNEIFLQMAGYSRDELMYANHNLIRHPDMPRVAFKLAWDLIKAKKEFFGFVKNLAKDGSYYWVFTYITADLGKNGDIVGYTSFRRKPSKIAIDTVKPIYQLLLQKEREGGMESSGDFLFNHLKSAGITYDEFVLNLQKKG